MTWKRRIDYYLHNPTGRLTLLKFSLIGILVGSITLFLVTTILFAVFSFDLPDPNKVLRREGYSSIIYDRSGTVLYDVYKKENRIPLELADIPKDLRNATIAIEDKDFYRHQGFDLLGIIRALRNLLFYRQLGGGSTLTQQLVKNVLLTSERSLTRKIKEVILSYQIEKRFTKDQILQMYLNEAPYGGATYGVESASQHYFGKHARDLTLVESAILAGLPQQPTTYSPYGSHPKAYIGRTHDVLRRLNEDGYITKQQQVDSEKQLGAFQFASVSGDIKAPHFVFYVRDQLVNLFGEQAVENAGLRVTTSLDYDLQVKAESIVKDEVLKIKKLNVGNGAAVILNPRTGEIISMVGSYDYTASDYDGNVNVATSLRQPGSAGKPFIYAAALSQNYTPATLLLDVKTDFPSGDPVHPMYIPGNYDGKYRGPVQMRFALGNSLNIPAVKMTALVGVKMIMDLGFRAGITTWEPTEENMRNVGLSLALGGREVKLLELSSAYGVFANEGKRVEPISILRVTDAKGKKLYEAKPASSQQVLAKEVAFLISHILSDDNARKEVFGPNSQLVIPNKTVSVKTGTTDQKRDNWAVGYTPSIIVGVWVGNNDNSVMNPAVTSGVTGASPIWNRLMKLATANLSDEVLSKPDSVTALEIDAFGGGLPVGEFPKRSEYFVKGTEPPGTASIYRRVKVSKANGKLANDLEIKTGAYDEKDFIVITEADRVSSDGKNRWQEAIDKWVAENKKDDPKYKVPTEKSDANSNSVIIQVTDPSDHQSLSSNDVHIKARVLALHAIKKFRLEVDGSDKLSKEADSLDETINLADGKHTLKFHAEDDNGNSSDAELHIGVKVPWDSP